MSCLDITNKITDAGVKDQSTKMFPENLHGMQESVITSVALTVDFLVFSNDVCFMYPEGIEEVYLINAEQ